MSLELSVDPSSTTITSLRTCSPRSDSTHRPMYLSALYIGIMIESNGPILLTLQFKLVFNQFVILPFAVDQLLMGALLSNHTIFQVEILMPSFMYC